MSDSSPRDHAAGATGALEPFGAAEAIDAHTLPLELEPVPAANEPSEGLTTGWASLGEYAGGELGVWQLSRGEMIDTEAEELFVVISGEATIDFVEPARPSISVHAGSIVRLEAGMRTKWTVTTPQLRKVVLLPA